MTQRSFCSREHTLMQTAQSLFYKKRKIYLIKTANVGQVTYIDRCAETKA